MKTSKKLNKIYDMNLEICMLTEVLHKSLKCIEYDEGKGTACVYICKLIEEKWWKIINLL